MSVKKGTPAGAALVLYVMLALAAFYPQSLRPSNTIAYVGDSLESVYLVAWNVHQLFRSPGHLFDANVLYPLPHPLTHTDHRLLPSIVVAPVLWASGNPVLAYNVAVLLGSLLAAMAGWYVARGLGIDPIGAWTAGALYAFNTYQVNESPRLNVIFHGFIALALGQLILFLKTGDRRRAAAVAGLMLLEGLSSNYQLLYGSLLLGLVAAGALLARPRTVAPRVAVLAVAALAAALALTPLLWPYVRAARAQRLARELPEGIDVQHYLSTAPTNLIYGPMGAEVRRQQRGPHFVGLLALGLAGLAVGAWLLGRSPAEPPTAWLPVRVWVPAAAALALLLAALSLGRDAVAFGHRLGPGPYRLLYDWVPGFRLVRIPERLALLAMLFLALLVGRGVMLLRAARLPLVAAFLAVAVPVEHLSPIPYPERVPVGHAVPTVYSWLGHDRARALAELPIRGEGHVREETLEMYFSTYHWKPIIEGYTAYPSLLTRVLRRLAAQFPSGASLQALQRVGVDTVVVHQGRPLAPELAMPLRGTPPEKERAFSRLVRLTGQDLYARLPSAIADGFLRREARFAGPGAHLYKSDADEVYRIVDAPSLAPAPFPVGHRLRDPAWRYRSKVGDPAPVGDGDLSTSYRLARPLVGDEFIEVTFGGPLRVAGLVLPLRWDSVFPTRFRVAGRDRSGGWFEVARFDDAHALQLLDRLLVDPASAALGFDLGGREAWGLVLLVEEGGTSFDGWSIPEIEVWVP
jgi:hypothetical protein